MKLYELCIDTDVKRYEYEIREVGFDKTFNYIKLKIKANIWTSYFGLINVVDCQQKNVNVISLKPFSDEDIERLTRYIRSHKKG